MAPIEFRADSVVRHMKGNAVALAVVYDVQLTKDKRKRRSWPACVANAYAQIGCPVVLLVMCPHRGVARWSAKPIVVGEPDFVLRPTVYGPDIVDLEHADLYAKAVLDSMPEASRSYLDKSMANTERRFHLDFLQESYERGQANGEARGEAKSILTVLRARGVDVPDDVRARVTDCTDADQLVWLGERLPPVP
jgi:hypothetical protein